jgi:hypothetical protein
MKASIAFCFAALFAATLMAQKPLGGGGGFGGPGGFAGRGPGMLGVGPGSRTPVTGAPYSATETLQRQQSLANGNQILTKEQSNVNRDGQGRIRTEETITPPAATGKPAFTRITIFDPVAGFQYILDSSTMTARQFPVPAFKGVRQPPPDRPARPTPPNVTTTSLGTQSINGVAATGTQITETIPAGAIGNAQPIQIVRITWISNDLKVPVQIKTSDPRFGSSDMELTNIATTEPSASLFIVPAGYTIQQGGGGRNGGPGAQGRRGRPPV